MRLASPALVSGQLCPAGYSPDGKRIVVGINSGIRVLSREEKWTSKDDKDIKEIDLKKNFRGARGDLVELQWIGANTVLASANIDGKLSLFEVDMDTRSSEKVTVPESLSAAAKFGSDNKVLLAFGEGKLGIGELTRGKEKKELVIGNLSELEDKHRARISKLVVHPKSSNCTTHHLPLDPFHFLKFNFRHRRYPSSE